MHGNVYAANHVFQVQSSVFRSKFSLLGRVSSCDSMQIARSKNQRSRLNGVFLTLMSMVVLVALLFVLLCQVHDNEMVRSVMDSVASVSPEVKEYTVQVKVCCVP